MNERLDGGIKVPVNIEDEMKRSYMDYAMSVIIGRALPDVRDGLKPVHRRILYTMHDQKNDSSHPYRKSARIVGDVMGKLHPHGDMAIYDSIVRMAQDFSLRYTLVDGQGNFGSLDGDAAAAMRYTEIRLEKLAEELLLDIDKDTVDFVPNYDGSLEEPEVLPARIPNLLVNGSSGIAVGMATNIPPHNLGEVIDATVALIDEPEVEDAVLFKLVPGPDFPTGAFICGLEGIRSAYKTGRGSIKMRARALVEKQPRGDKEHIVITEIPFQVNKAKLMEDIAGLVRDRKVEGVSELRDESDRDGVRIVLELRRGTIPGVILNSLFKHTQLETNFGTILLSILNNQPRLLTLREMLGEFIAHRKVVVTRRTRYELRKAEERAHILEGLKKALDNLDKVIALIRASRTPADAKAGLMERFEFSELQAQAILDMRLQRLTGLEREKILEEYRELLKTIARLKEILASERVLMSVIRAELIEEKEKHGDARRTEIIPDAGEISIEDMIAEEEMVISVTRSNYIKRSAVSVYRKQRRGGKGVRGMSTRQEDLVEHLFVASTHSYILVFTQAGRVYWLKVHEIPEAGAAGKGKAIVNLLNVSSEEKVAALLAARDLTEPRNVIMATRRGVVKKTELPSFQHPRVGGIIAISVDEGDELLSVQLSSGDEQVFLGTHLGHAIRFPERDIRAMGRTARGVIGIRLRKGDFVQEMAVIGEHGTILSVTEKGYGKRTDIAQYRLQSRGGSGVINLRVTERNGPVVGIKHVQDDDQMFIITAQGMAIRLRVGDIRVIGRSTQGVRMINLREGDAVVAVARLAEKDTGEGEEGAEGVEMDEQAAGEAEWFPPEEVPEEDEEDEIAEDEGEDGEFGDEDEGGSGGEGDEKEEDEEGGDGLKPRGPAGKGGGEPKAKGRGRQGGGPRQKGKGK